MGPFNKGVPTMTYCKFDDRFDPETRVHTFHGSTDSKGRQIGAKVRTFVRTWKRATNYRLVTNGDRTYAVDTTHSTLYGDVLIEREPGTEYGFAPHATRGGKDYGAYTGYRLFATELERDAAIGDYLIAAAKRAAKAAK